MNARLARKIESTMDFSASAILAGAAGFAGFALVGEWRAQLAIAGAAIGGGAAYFISRQLLGALASRQQVFGLAEFDVADLPADELLLTDADRVCDELLLTESDRLGDELLLTESDRVGNELVLTASDRLVQANQDVLVLDDVLEAMAPDSRVVRLFDPRAMATPGALQSRIDQHIDRASSENASHDASQELADALAELRKALR